MNDNNISEEITNKEDSSNQSEVEVLKQRIVELENNWKRALADYRNFQKRVEEDKQSFITFATTSLISRLLPIVDNLEMLDKHLNDMAIKMILKEFNQVLSDEGLKEISAQGKEFDSVTMDAIEMIEGEENKVMEVLNKGYLLKDKLIRPARVKVGKGKYNLKEEK